MGVTRTMAGYQPTNKIDMGSVILPSGDAARPINRPERYLTNGQKCIELSEFHERCIPDQDGLASLPDCSMIRYLTELNSIPGLCTLQSCSGHIKRDVRDQSEYVTNGGLWIWLSREMMQRFYIAAFELRQRSGYRYRQRVNRKHTGSE